MIRSALAQLQNERKKVISIKFLANALNIAKTTYFIINSSTNGYCIGRQGVIGGVEFYKIGQMRTKSRGCAFHFVEIQSVFCPYLQNGLEFIYETWQLWSKFQLDHLDTPTLEIWNICAYVNCSYSLLHIIIRSSWHDMNLELTLGKPFW